MLVRRDDMLRRVVPGLGLEVIHQAMSSEVSFISKFFA
jgi:hypothetical protein